MNRKLDLIAGIPFYRAVAALLILGSASVANAAALAAFGFAEVASRAQQLAANPYRKQESSIPDALRDLGYDQYRDIRYKTDHAVWHKDKLPFELEFFHPGLYYTQPVKISEIAPNGTHEIRFDPNDFEYGDNKLDLNQLKGLSFSGFRVHFPINTPKYKDEVLLFQGASYFRALGKGQKYGLSARGLAIDTGLISGEEFPQFVEFWIVKPKPDDKELVIYGLLDSRRVTGAYRFILKPGLETAIEVKERVFMRENVTKLGIAPLTSMYFFSENQHSSGEDYRPEVHDSDGLSIHSGTGEWLWRPLVNPRRLLVTSFSMTNPLGFGLMQRDRNFNNYQDLEARYDLRPSAWVEPKGQWGAGRVELVQIPSPNETNDNIVAFWVPDTPPQAGQSLDMEYNLQWQMTNDVKPPLAWVAQTRRGRGYTRNPDGSIGFIIDFEGSALEKLPPDAKIDGVISVDGNGELLERTTYRNEVTGGWRVSLRLHRLDENKPVEMRAYLRSEAATLSETWSYILPPG